MTASRWAIFLIVGALVAGCTDVLGLTGYTFTESDSGIADGSSDSPIVPAADASYDAPADHETDAFVASCTDGIKDGTETDVDCGGSCAAHCASGEHCKATGGLRSNARVRAQQDVPPRVRDGRREGRRRNGRGLRRNDGPRVRLGSRVPRKHGLRLQNLRRRRDLHRVHEQRWREKWHRNGRRLRRRQRAPRAQTAKAAATARPTVRAAFAPTRPAARPPRRTA